MTAGAPGAGSARLALVGLAAAVAMVLALPADWTVARAAPLVVLVVALWATRALPEWLSGLVFLAAVILLGVAPPPVALGGFLSSATWMVLAGMVIGASIQATGLGDRIAGLLAPRLGATFARRTLVVLVAGMALAFIMPSSMGRVLLYVPILLALCERLGHGPGTRERQGLLLAGILGTFVPAFAILPANVPNMVLMGASEAIHGLHLGYAEYLLLHYPVLGILKGAVIWGLILLFHRGAEAPPLEAPAPMPPLSAAEGRLAAVLAVAVALWATDQWHGLPAAWVGMAAALICLYPGLGLGGPKLFQTLGLEPVFLVAAIVGMGAVAAHAGLADSLAGAALDMLPLDPEAPARTFGLLSLLAAATGLAVTVPGIPAVLTPIAPALADASGWPLPLILMVQTVGFSTFILAYQAPPLVVATRVGGLSVVGVARVVLALALASMALLWPLEYLWWRLLGVIPLG